MVRSVDRSTNAMSAPRSSVVEAVDALVAEGPGPSATVDLGARLDDVLASPAVRSLLLAVLDTDAYAAGTGHDLAAHDALRSVPALRRLRTSLSASVATFVGLLHDLLEGFDPAGAASWREFADRLRRSPVGDRRLVDALRAGADGDFWQELADRLVVDDPHARYATSPYRWSDGDVVSSDDGRVVEAVMTSRTFTSIRVVEGVLDPTEPLLRDVYAATGRCVAVIDRNVDERWGQALRAYFAHHDIALHTLVYRAMEVDKGIRTVERMLGDFKRLGVKRTEPVLVAGGGVLSDTAGLACALYHRNTPYVMLSTSLVAGIDAGPSPRTCCDGFGYKNLIGAYHAPILSITDRTFFATMHEGWLRHGVAEIIKMAVVKDAALFAALEQAGPELVTTRFGTTDTDLARRVAPAAQAILAGAMRSYVEAEYDNLYETHQARPHAYGHTWSPGFEIPAGLLHGHAVAIGMGFGALLSHRAGWIDEASLHRILTLMSDFGLSLWHDVLDDVELVWQAQQKVEQKRGGQLVAPLPRGGIGSCGYLEDLSRDDLAEALAAYRTICATYPRHGVGIDPLCADVGLEDPSTVADDLPPQHDLDTAERTSARPAA
jgi:3-dehydroquinate synthetase